jgi:hypothetical protein
MIPRIAEDYERFATHASRRKKGRMEQSGDIPQLFSALAGFEGGGALALR